MFIYYLIASWIVTVIACTVIKSIVSDYQERQITCGGLITSPLSNAATRAASLSSTHAHSQYNETSVTDRELLALQRTPTFQLWAEAKSRTISRRRLYKAQQVFVYKLIAFITLCLALFACPFDTTFMDVAVSGGKVDIGTFNTRNNVLQPHTLMAMARASDVASGTRWVNVEGKKETTDQQDEYDGPSAFPQLTAILFRYLKHFGMYQVMALLGIVLMVWAAAQSVLQAWLTVSRLSTACESLVSFMATTNYDPKSLAEEMNRVASGDFGINEMSSSTSVVRRCLGCTSFRLAVGLVVVRFGATAVAAYNSATNGAYASPLGDTFSLRDGKLLMRSIVVGGEDSMQSSSVGLIMAAVATFVFVCF